MLEETTLKGRVIGAALRLAGERAWSDVTLRDIAGAAGADLVQMRHEFASKGAIVAAFLRAVDDEVLAKAPRFTPDQPPRDRIFEVVMSRLDVLRPYKAGLRSMAASHAADPAVLRGLCASQAWMLHAAGIGTEGVIGAARVAGLASVYASVFRTWLDDDEAGIARTMAALDRRLRRGEQALAMVDDVCRAACRAAEILMQPPRRSAPAGPAPSGAPPTGPGPNQPSPLV